MSNEPRIPDPQTRARSVARLRELVQRWDVLIAGLDELNARLEEDTSQSIIAAYLKRRAERLAAQKQESNLQV